MISVRIATKSESKYYHEVKENETEYDFSNSIKNPCTKKINKQISIRIENETVEYFKNLA
jgi:uncharacterized protein (DUF4415 family)